MPEALRCTDQAVTTFKHDRAQSRVRRRGRPFLCGQEVRTAATYSRRKKEQLLVRAAGNG
eukprot:6929813-Heterocapsa_arctica.AAC.1